MGVNEKGGYHNNLFFHFNMVLENENSPNSCFRRPLIAILVKVIKEIHTGKRNTYCYYGMVISAHSIKKCMLKYVPIFTLKCSD